MHLVFSHQKHFVYWIQYFGILLRALFPKGMGAFFISESKNDDDLTHFQAVVIFRQFLPIYVSHAHR